MAVQISPSILSADFARLADEAAAVPNADWLHVDVMDNHFVPNLTLGLPVVEALLKATSLPIDCHLMITDPDRWAPSYAEAGAGSVTIHAEASSAPVRTLRQIRSLGSRAGLALNPATAVEPYEDLIGEIDMLLLMTVEPGFGGQKFLDMVLPKIRRAGRSSSGTGARCGSRWTVASPPTPSSAARRRARTCSWRATRCTPRPTGRRPSTPCAPWPPAPPEPSVRDPD